MISYEELSLVFDMDNPLTLEYFELCSKDTEEPKYCHKHHILPKSIYPEFRLSEWNIVKLTYKDHYRAHELLPFICLHEVDRYKMANAWTMMGRFKAVVDADEGLWEHLYKLQVESKLGANNPMYGKSPSVETRAKASKSLTGLRKPELMKQRLAIAKTGTKMPREGVEKSAAAHRGKVPTAEARENMRNSQLGRKHSEDTKRKQSEWHKGRPRTPEVIEKRRATILGKSLKKFLDYLAANTKLIMLGSFVKMQDSVLLRCALCTHEFVRQPMRIKRYPNCPKCYSATTS